MKKHFLVLHSSLVLFGFLSLFSSCTKINEATTLGADLIPAVDNINTFETTLEANTSNSVFDDSTKLGFTQQVALGYLKDPQFGITKGDIYFNVAPTGNNVNPFTHVDSVISIDSVVLSLSYASFYGDTETIQAVKVYEIAQSARFKDTALYEFDQQTDFATTGVELGARTFAIKELNDPLTLIRGKDTTRTTNVLRIRLSNSLGERFKTYDNTTTAAGGFRNDSTFYTLFKGLSVQAQSSGNALAYFSLRDAANTKLTVYFRKRNGKIDTTFTDFVHNTNGQANIIKRTTAGSAFGSALAANNGSKIFIQSSPGFGASYAGISIPGLNTFQNSIVHRAELIVSRIDTDPVNDKIFLQPARLYLDRKRKVGDSVFFFQRDLVDLSGNLNPEFGGILEKDGTYRFNLTRYVQSIITGRELNDSLRLFAPLQVTYRLGANAPPFTIPVNSGVAFGRIILGGGTHPDAASRLRLRIIYSKIR